MVVGGGMGSDGKGWGIPAHTYMDCCNKPIVANDKSESLSTLGFGNGEFKYNATFCLAKCWDIYSNNRDLLWILWISVGQPILVIV